MSVSCCLLLFLFSSMSSAIKVLSRSELRCSRQDVKCSASESSCLDPGLLRTHAYTPSGPESLQVGVSSRPDEAGRLQPVLTADWTIRDDGSVRFLEATELHVLVLSTNENRCLRYSFREQLAMRSPSGEKWSFSADMLVLDPGQSYRVSVFNVPRPELRHTWYNVSRDVTVPDCNDSRLRQTHFCIERGSLWRPNITLEVADGGAVLVVRFLPDPLCEKYRAIVSCSSVQHTALVHQGGGSVLNSSFSLDQWPRSCCSFTVEVQPLFPGCQEDCTRVWRTADICPETPPDTPDAPDVRLYLLLLLLLLLLLSAALGFLCRKSGLSTVGSGEKPPPPPPLLPPPPPPQPKQPPKVLVIYSQDHRLYRDVVLKLCAFLQAKCGTKVLVDLLDSASVGVVGRLRWLEQQRRRLSGPSDKILVLCSRGVQAKWRALCGQRRVTLREDVLSPTDDMLTPFLNLFLPSMHQAGALGQYLVAYFEDISGERDVPSVFDIAVKYRLMKHFEELFFRILDVEKYQPGLVSHIRGIGAQDYGSCPAGRALQLAIRAFHAYQLQHPAWFEEECLHGEEELTVHAAPPAPPAPPVMECVPLIRAGPPAYRQEVEVSGGGGNIRLVAPELRPQTGSVARVAAVLHPELQHPPALLQLLADPLDSRGGGEPVYVTEPVLNRPVLLGPEGLCLRAGTSGSIPAEQEEQEEQEEQQEQEEQEQQEQQEQEQEEQDALLTWFSLQNSPSRLSSQSRNAPPAGVVHRRAGGVEEGRVLDQTIRGSSSGSDQGYSSRTSTQTDPPLTHHPLLALAQLQEELFEQSLRP